MRMRDLTEIVGRRDGYAISRALRENWESWDRFERQEAASRTDTERSRRTAAKLGRLGVPHSA